jgi:hypothetical protein
MAGKAVKLCPQQAAVFHRPSAGSGKPDPRGKVIELDVYAVGALLEATIQLHLKALSAQPLLGQHLPRFLVPFPCHPHSVPLALTHSALGSRREAKNETLSRLRCPLAPKLVASEDSPAGQGNRAAARGIQVLFQKCFAIAVQGIRHIESHY